ncbi:MAG: hypothetical protein KBA86_05405 [Bacteroidales bacterium]|nr:hypothetical protein [Bacteroidales bacterium]
MKTIKTLIYFAFIIFFFSCEKDYLNEYVGDFLCQKIENEYDRDSIYPTVISNETVSITKVNDSLIGILGAKVKFNPQTKTFGGWYPDAETNYRVLYGWFSNDSIYIETSKGGLAAGIDCYYKGIKQ